MTDRPILFSAPMVRALLDGRKSQTRRILPNPEYYGCPTGDCPHDKQEQCNQAMKENTAADLRFAVGDRLWVKESTRWFSLGHDCEITYLADNKHRQTGPNTGEIPDEALAKYFKRIDKAFNADRHAINVPSIFLSRWASRLTLTVTNVRVQQLQDISYHDAVAEGCEIRQFSLFGADAAGRDKVGKAHYSDLWDSINDAPGKRWADNPWIVAVSFAVDKRNIDDRIAPSSAS